MSRIGDQTGRRYVFDLDDTICTGKPYESAVPVDRVVGLIRKLKERGAFIIIHTARGMKTFDGDVSQVISHYGEMTHRWLRENDVPYDSLVFGKPSADLYVDDKALNVKDMFW